MQRNRWVKLQESMTYLLVSALIVYASLLPLISSRDLPSNPDLIYCMTMAWVMRRPDSLPVFLIAIVAILTDIILAKPLGLWSLLMIGAAGFFRGRETGKGVQMRLVEWLSVSVIFALMLLAMKLVFMVSFSPAPGLREMGWHFFLTALAYPPVVALMYWVMKIRAPLPADRSRKMGRVG